MSDHHYEEIALRLANAVLDGSLPIFAACRQLSRPLWKLYLYDEEPFSRVREVAGKLHEFPTPGDRHLWDPSVVAKKETELAAWLPLVQDDVLAACREIVQRFGEGG
jgi:hypothetical protein